MASEAEPTASGSGSFSDFWQKTGKKFKFVSSNREGGGGDGNHFFYFWNLDLIS